MTNAITRTTRTTAATMRADSRRSRLCGTCGVSSATVAVAASEVLVDHTVHVQDVALLAGVQTRPGPPGRAHPLLHVGEILVVLLGDLPPAALAPVLEELRLDPARLGGVGRAPLEHPGVLDRTVGIE